MASSTLAPFYLDGNSEITANGDLFAVEFEGLSLRLTPNAFLHLMETGRRAFTVWDHASRFRDERKIVQFSRKKAAK